MSVAFRAGEAAAWCDGALLRGDPDSRLLGVSTDTRSIEAGQLFVAVVGPRHDAHDFLPAAQARGAAGFLVERGRALPDELAADRVVIAVDDTTRALGALARGHRRGFDGPLVAITGSSGKTTTKEMCAAILSVGAPTLKNRGNLNNEYGLPLTLLAREPDQRRVVVELGMNHRGEIAALAQIAQPDVGVVTNVGTAHIEYLGSRDEIAREKGDLLAALPGDGVAVVPADDDYADALAARTRARVVRFGRSDDADVRCSAVRPRADRGFQFRLHAAEGEIEARVDGLGETTLLNALAATAAALGAGASLDEVARGLARHRPLGGRLERRDLPGDVVLIDDTYNANPQSLEAALRLLAGCEARGRRIAVLGDMGELGDASEAAHLEAGRLVARLGIDRLVAVGERAALVARGAREAGMSPASIQVLRDSETAGAPVRDLLEKGDWVLVKGSRAAHMEHVTRHLSEELG